MTNDLKNFVRQLNPKRQLEESAAEQFSEHYGDVFVSGTLDLQDDVSSSLGGKWDAFAHMYTSAILTQTFGSAGSHLIGDINELRPNNSISSMNQDLWNNALGREIGGSASEDIGQEIFLSIEDGKAITDRSLDTRMYNEGSFIENYADPPLLRLYHNAETAVSSTVDFIGTSINSVINSLGSALLTAQNHVSPLAFDLDDDGIESTHIYDDTEVYFDIDNDGFKERVGWINADDGQLAIDTNGDSVINDITELFGDDIMPANDNMQLIKLVA